MTKEAGKFEGMFYAKANKEIIKYLEETNDLFAAKELTHQYPHCWRCKSQLYTELQRNGLHQLMDLGKKH